jgi:hypothetical protein
VAVVDLLLTLRVQALLTLLLKQPCSTPFSQPLSQRLAQGDGNPYP